MIGRSPSPVRRGFANAADLFASGLLDCDNTLLDNDLVEDDLRDCLAVEFRSQSRDRYWAIFEQLGPGRIFRALLWKWNFPNR